MTPTPTWTPECQARLVYVGETVPDGTEFKPGETFDKVWRIRNDSPCPWPGGSLRFSSGDRMGASASASVPAIPQGKTYDISLPMQAPSSPGDYLGKWLLSQPDGSSLVLMVAITVRPPGVEIPDLYGKTVSDANRQLDELRFGYTWKDGCDAGAKQGTVIDQAPKAGTYHVPQNTTVVLTRNMCQAVSINFWADRTEITAGRVHEPALGRGERQHHPPQWQGGDRPRNPRVLPAADPHLDPDGEARQRDHGAAGDDRSQSTA